MGRPKTTGCSQNASATMYMSANHLEYVLQVLRKLLTELFVKWNNNPTPSSVGVE